MDNKKSHTKIIGQQVKKKLAVFELMQVMINGKKPKEILKLRRPVESQNNHTLQYRLDNFYPIQVSLFKRAILQYIEVINKADINVITNSEILDKWIIDNPKIVNNKKYSLKEWFFNYIAEQKQLDPNAIVVVHPKIIFINNKPIEVVASTSSPEIEISYVPTNNIQYEEHNVLKFTAGSIVIDGISHDYYIIVNDKQYDVSYPYKSENGSITYTNTTYMSHKVGVIPFEHIGSVIMTDCIDGNTFEYFESDFYGAVNIACYMIGALSDKQVMKDRFVYPIKYGVKRKCVETGCTKDDDGKHYIYNQKNEKVICSGCNGSGYSKDTDMFGTYILENGNKLDGTDINLQAPYGFVTPPIESLRFANEDFDSLKNLLAQELCVNLQQNMTNQSGESKSYDVMNKVTFISYIIEDILRIVKNIYSYSIMLLDNTDTANVQIVKPQSYDIKSKEDIISQINKSKSENAPYPQLLELTIELMHKELSDIKNADWIVKILIEHDDLIVYGLNDFANAKIVFGAEITPRQLYINRKGLIILKKLISNPELDSYEKLENEFLAEVDKNTATNKSII